MRSALFSFPLMEMKNGDLDIADQNGEVRGVRGVRVIHLAITKQSTRWSNLVQRNGSLNLIPTFLKI